MRNVPSPDAELLSVCAAFDATEHQRNAMFDDGTLTDEANAMLRAAQDRRVERMCILRALTPRGWQARARSLLLFDDEFLERRHVHANDRMMAAILRDLVEDGLTEAVELCLSVDDVDKPKGPTLRADSN